MNGTQPSPPRSRPTPSRDSLGCSLAALCGGQELTGPGFVLHRKSHDGRRMSRVETPPSDRGVLMGVCLSGGHRRRIFSGRRSAVHDFEPDSSYVRAFADDYLADIETGFEFVLLEISQGELCRTLDEMGLPPADGISAPPGRKDPVLAHLARALLPALAQPASSSPLFVSQVVSALQTHIVQRYHGAAAHVGRGGLSATQLRRAQELLMAGVDGAVLISDIAAACNVSRSHFIRAFRQATGATPYQWLLARRVEQARALLTRSRLSLAEVAIQCGFSDQSHMTRTVARLTGSTPGAWRRGR
ncbi:helix-turn-helix transcriptional regulator [Xanthobacter autotrophicus]|uniref:helix-turn-helix domain-containing protein n=1 Tax=Xanthobacter TaxID=279 RepID=UPI0024AA558D|nr:helix-turn-helix transcriptional regulator [Xanthobacter autotrophicus]MDI4664104.1 helix-turn-helix transcriptional regulator [Xanthobacter autotrophicus]